MMMKKIKRHLTNLIYKLLVRLVDHDSEKINTKLIFNWLADSYENQGFKDYLTSQYARYAQYLTAGYRSDYQSVVDRLMSLRMLEKAAKDAAESRAEKKISK